jgi:hypothetical protein
MKGKNRGASLFGTVLGDGHKHLPKARSKAKAQRSSMRYRSHVWSKQGKEAREGRERKVWGAVQQCRMLGKEKQGSLVTEHRGRQ